MIRLISFILSIYLMGCSAPQKINTIALQHSQEAYEKARNNHSLQRHAPTSLFQAGKLYTLCTTANTPKQAAHFAYLLEQEVKVAKERTKKAILKERLKSLQEGVKEAKALKQKEAREALDIEESKPKLEDAYRGLEGLVLEQREEGMAIVLGSEYFSEDKALLQGEAARAISQLSRYLQAHPNQKVLIAGHTDSSHGSVYNIDLSLRRADRVAQALEYGGVSSDRMKTKGYGELRPIEDNESAFAMKNNRVEIILLGEEEDKNVGTRESQRF